MMANPKAFVDQLVHFDIKSISKAAYKKVSTQIADEKYSPEKAKRVSSALVCFS